MSFRVDSNFVFTDLSSYDTNASRRFYAEVFGWKTQDMGKAAAASDDRFGMDQVTYHAAMQGAEMVAGIYDMPPFFRKLKMPPFWMSYLAVDDIHGVVARAKETDGVIVDVPPTPFGDGTMALIRDPLGAGFTCYDGPSIDSKGDGSGYGRMVWNELFTSSITGVAPFYSHVLGLDVVPDDRFQGTRAKLLNRNGQEIAGIRALDKTLRGDKVYWLPSFSVDSVGSFSARAVSAGGTLLSQDEDSALFFDNSRAAFGVIQTGAPYGNTRH